MADLSRWNPFKFNRNRGRTEDPNRETLPADVDTDAAEAHFDKGVLTVKMLHVEVQETGPRKLEF